MLFYINIYYPGGFGWLRGGFLLQIFFPTYAPHTATVTHMGVRASPVRIYAYADSHILPLTMFYIRERTVIFWIQWVWRFLNPFQTHYLTHWSICCKLDSFTPILFLCHCSQDRIRTYKSTHQHINKADTPYFCQKVSLMFRCVYQFATWLFNYFYFNLFIRFILLINFNSLGFGL